MKPQPIFEDIQPLPRCSCECSYFTRTTFYGESTSYCTYGGKGRCIEDDDWCSPALRLIMQDLKKQGERIAELERLAGERGDGRTTH
jgi:hypothetical protein